MDKYEYTLRLDQMKSRFAEEKYEEAAEIADTINWNKVKNVNGLVKAGEVYEKVQLLIHVKIWSLLHSTVHQKMFFPKSHIMAAARYLPVRP